MNKDELAKLILSCEDAMYHIGMSILRNETDVEDAVQNTIVKAFEKYMNLRQSQYARTWLIRILINECRDIQRKRRYFDDAQDAWEAADATAPTQEESWQDYSPLYAAVNALPEQQRLVVMMFYADEFSVKEISRILHLPEGTIKSRLSRARRALKNELEGREICYVS